MRESLIQRIAGIDLGSNSLKMAVAGLRAGHAPEITVRERIPLRLATDAFKDESFSVETIDRLVEACWRFSEILEKVHVGHYRAVGTEAFRRSGNVEQVLTRILEGSGLRVEVLTAEMEAWLVVQAIRRQMIGGREPDLIVDLGGGSLEICAPAGEEEVGLRLESHSLGLAARFETFLEARSPGRISRMELRVKASELGAELVSELLDAGKTDTIVISGGQAGMLDALAVEWGMWGEDYSTINGVTQEELQQLCERTVVEETESLTSCGIPADRAPMLSGAAAFYYAIAVRSGASRIVIPRTGLMDGILLTLPDQGHAWPAGEESSS
ncbi:hypothetical protein ACFL6T_02725 [Candidatus Zixiibacteriota bacterium]